MLFHFSIFDAVQPLPLGHKRKLSDWEILTYCSWIAFFVMVAIAWWAKPETDLYVWAREELREREILAHREYVHSFCSSLQ